MKLTYWHILFISSALAIIVLASVHIISKNSPEVKIAEEILKEESGVDIDFIFNDDKK